jgi:hypothetical protein
MSFLYKTHPEKCVEYIDRMLIDVYTCEGRVFGSYLRDVIMQDFFEKKHKPFTSVNIWFSRESDYNKFISINEGAVVCDKIEWKDNYRYQQVNGILYYNDIPICPVIFTINPSTIPTTNFDIDNVVMGVNIEDEFANPRLFAVNGYNLDKIITAFSNKVAILTNGMMNDVLDLEDRDWKVIDRNGDEIGANVKQISGITDFEIQNLNN